MERECFGGNNETRVTQANYLDGFGAGDARLFERCRNAYLLFYERVTPVMEESSALLKKTSSLDPSVYHRIWEENGAFMKLKIFFDQEYFQFVREYVSRYTFRDVHYPSRDHSDTAQLRKLRELT
mmetsp:Transcript_45853/g.33603  ORF Transcript_45853/g.33603 Transcript_45853/m.33603 type:complete len:125 (+) Transcript_45853:571-945(+)